MNFQKIRFATGAEKMCNFFLIRLLLVFGGGKSKAITSQLAQNKQLYI